MKIILMKNIENLGQKDEIVEVADGYARNFLVPQNLGLKATPGNVKQCEEKKRLIQQKKEKGKFKALKMAEKLRGTKIILEREMGEEGKLFGVVWNMIWDIRKWGIFSIWDQISTKIRLREYFSKTENKKQIKNIFHISQNIFFVFSPENQNVF